MGTRLKWFILNYSSDAFDMIREGMLKNELVPDARAGFRLEGFEEKLVVGRFIVRNEITENVEDPFGNNVTFERIFYDITKFKIDANSNVLELQDPPRSTKELFNKIATFAEYNIAIEAPVIDLHRWINSIEKRVGDITVTKLHGTGISLSLKANAQLLVTGSEDVRPHFTTMVNKKPSIITKAKIQFGFDGHQCILEISNQGTAQLSNSYDDRLVRVLVDSMLDSKL